MKTIQLNLTVNGHRFQLLVNENVSLLDLLRQHLHLTGAKRGCASGDCGACTVIVNDQAVQSCKIPARSVNDAEILTIEGVAANDGSLHPLQKAFLDTGAVQSGFCTPGMILAAIALLKQNPKPTRQNIIDALKNNLCRCTGYQPIIEAVLAVSQPHSSLSDENPILPHPSSKTGEAVHRIDGTRKVTGTAQ